MNKKFTVINQVKLLFSLPLFENFMYNLQSYIVQFIAHVLKIYTNEYCEKLTVKG